MRYILILSLILGFSFPSLAQDASVDFKVMSITELQSVDTGALSKKQKKAHKRALKKKQKAEKNRLKKVAAAKKKEAQKAAKEAKKAAKEKAKFDKKVAKTYKNTRVYKDDFEAFQTIQGPNHNLYKFFDNAVYGDAQWWLKTQVHPNGQKKVVLYLSFFYEGRKRKFFTNAAIRGGQRVQAQVVNSRVDECQSMQNEGICTIDTIAMAIPEGYLLDSYSRGQTMDVSTRADNGERIIVQVSKTYLKGYITKAQATLGLFTGGQTADGGGEK